MNPSIHTLLVTRSPFYAEALARIIEKDQRIKVNTPPEFIVPLPPNSIHGASWIVIYDVNASHLVFDTYMDQLQERTHRPRILVYADKLSEDAMLYYLSRGIHGCLESAKLKSFLVVAINHVACGGIWFPHTTIAQFIDKVVSEMRHVSRLFRVDPPLSKREHEVWSLVSHGATNKDIAVQLRIAERTVKFHVSHLLQKLNAGNRRELMVRFGHTALFETK